jgi:hypothetical protein
MLRSGTFKDTQGSSMITYEQKDEMTQEFNRKRSLFLGNDLTKLATMWICYSFALIRTISIKKTIETKNFTNKRGM